MNPSGATSRRSGGTLLLVLAAAALAGAQESVPVADRLADKANHQNPYLSAQGLKAFKTQGEEAMPALERFIARRSIHALAPLVVEWLGEVPDDRARAILKQALATRHFPWKPQAAKALAKAPRASELDVFAAAARDALPAVREAAMTALGELGSRDAAAKAAVGPLLAAGMRDPLFEPRLAAAEALLRLGDSSALPVLAEALVVERRFFELDFGVLARRRAWAALEPLLGAGIAFDPSAGPARNAAALEEIRRRLRERGAPDGPATRSTLAADVDDALLGVEVRSCRSGDQWVRLTSGGELVLGHYDLDRRRIDEKQAREIMRLVRAVSQPDAAKDRLDPGAYFGRPGCDFEKWYMPDEAALVRVSVGQEGRPEALERLHAALGAAIESAFGHGAAQEFRDRSAPFAKPDAGED